ncbi:hypothetical protein [Xenorhabdus entomophaga]|uniref:hypothetical protein n=1 Tax=Xenorhabdus entomophaga TaxID=3136257 RepID=UPI0030F3F868
MLSYLGQYSVSSIEHIDRHEWDALVTDNDFFYSYGWLAGLNYALVRRMFLP